MKIKALFEGGNIVIGDQEASRIDLKKAKRSTVASFLLPSLDTLNREIEKRCGIPLWNQSLFNSLGFLSGSAKHFLDITTIEDDKFVEVKSTVGDIDTQCPLSMESLIEDSLKKMKGVKCFDLTFIGYKKIAGQFITLWKSQKLGYNIQIDLELVDFENGKPTQWAEFSHSSAWIDMEKGIKGVAHKYLLRALTVKSLKNVIILKGKNKQPKELVATEIAFSTLGARQKLKQVFDDSGRPRKINGLDVYEEISTAQSGFVTDLDVIFKMFFDVEPQNNETKLLWSTVGLCSLVDKYWNDQDKKKFLLGFANTLWGRGAQKLYNNDPQSDLSDKTAMYEYVRQTLRLSNPSEVDKWITAFYRTF